MIQFQLETDVPESREVTVTLPPDTPTGRVQLMLTVAEQAPHQLPGGWPYVRPADSQVAAEYDAFQRLFSELLATHNGEYVAVYQGRVVASGTTLDDVYRAVQSAFGDVPAYIAAVHDRMPEVRLSAGSLS